MRCKNKVLKLAFSGSKYRRIPDIYDLIKSKKYNRIVEVFGGSCCISNNMLRDKVVNQAIANDFDGYFEKFEENIIFKENLIKQLLHKGFEKSESMLSTEKQEYLKKLLSPIKEDKNLISFLSKNFVYSAIRANQTIDIKDFNYLRGELSTRQERLYYEELKNVQLDRLHYEDFISKYVQNDDKTTLVILDPPYMNARQKQYQNTTYFGITETLKLLNLMKDKRNDFLFFNMRKDDTTALLDLLNLKYTYQTRMTSISKNNVREDFLAYITF